MSTKRKVYTADFKSKLVLKVLEGEKIFHPKSQDNSKKNLILFQIYYLMPQFYLVFDNYYYKPPNFQSKYP